MRLPVGDFSDEERAIETIGAAITAGITVFDTAHSYGPGPADLGHNERLLARGIRLHRAEATTRVVTKGGMARAGIAWIPDGRARVIVADCEAGLAALDGLPIDLYLLHAPDPRTPWRTSMRALARLVEQGLVHRVGVSNVNRSQLDEALDLAPIDAVQVPLSPFDDRAVRGGVLERCEETGVTLMAYSPLGGTRRAGGLARDPALAGVAAEAAATPAEVALAWLLTLSPVVVAIPGARRPETARSAARAATLRLDPATVATITRHFGVRAPLSVIRPGSTNRSEVVMVMGIAGAGKSRVAEEHIGRGYLRLNRDERGGTLRDLAAALDEHLAAGTPGVVLDNTYLTRASRSYVVEAARRHGVPVRCVWVDTPLAQAQVNLVERLLDRFGHLPSPEEVRAVARREPGLLMPTSQMRTLRELEAPSLDEGFSSVDTLPFARHPPAGRGSAGVFIAAAAMRRPGWEGALEQCDDAASHLLFDWVPDGTPAALTAGIARLAAARTGPVEGAMCPHGGGPPTCWCRPPLPGLLLDFSRRHGIDPARSTLVGVGPAHRTLATTLGAMYLAV
ncbi:MAG: hypothetical protein QOK05_2052 [Chloroflexota bacterium]|jgi:aryl-alcohol dehydrogenase-like predicted oxidoreductase|nr:hypothetical protein [Chloroflexota bacterium]